MLILCIYLLCLLYKCPYHEGLTYYGVQTWMNRRVALYEIWMIIIS